MLDDGQAQTNAFTVHVSRAMKLSKASEQLGEVFGRDSHTSITDIDRQSLGQ